jgi:radical SAM superfamily enzyme YgiQ (UPF0313 family)
VNAVSVAAQTRRRVLLVNPRITSPRHARFPLSLLALAAGLGRTAECRIIDGNVDGNYLATLRSALAETRYDAVGMTVMGGPQVRSAIDASLAVRAISPRTPVVWGGYFPTLYPDATLNAPYVDYAVRGQGEDALGELLEALGPDGAGAPAAIDGLSWKDETGPIHNQDRRFSDQRAHEPLPYELLGDARKYLLKTFMGQRTVAHQAALGCRFRCTFCGVAAMFRGAVALPPAVRLERDLTWLKGHLGADSVQFFDHNFFDREADMVPLLEVLARVHMPWWCYARADALLNLSSETWGLVRRSGLRMAYIGAESPNDALLRSTRKGTRAEQTLAVADLCRRNGVIPELSFMVAPPDDPEGETERTFEFIREVKRINPESEIIVYLYTPVPPTSLPLNARRDAAARPLIDLSGAPVRFPQTPEEWTERRWVEYSCHANAPWVSDRLRRRIRNFVTVLGCRFPTVMDIRAAPLGKVALKALASWRYRYRRYDRPWELDLCKRMMRPLDPRASSL